MFVNIGLCGIQCNSLIDTGSTLSVIHPDKYYTISATSRPALQPTSGELVMGDGGTVTPLGLIEADVQVGSGPQVHHQFIIADIQVPAVLGYDFLMQHHGAVDVRNQELILGECHIECQLESRLPSLFRINLLETVSIPPRSEVIVHAKVNNMDCDETSELYVESLPALTEKTGILVAKSLVTPQNNRIPLRLMNVDNEKKTMVQVPYSWTYWTKT